MLDSFNSLIRAAREQPEPQRLLLVFAQIVIPDDASEEEHRRHQAGQGGGLMPVMYVDKGEEEIADFESLLAEAQQVSKEWGEHMTAFWDLVIVGCMGGRAGRAPTSEDAEQPLKHIVQTIQTGGSLSHLAAFDRDGDPVRFE